MEMRQLDVGMRVDEGGENDRPPRSTSNEPGGSFDVRFARRPPRQRHRGSARRQWKDPLSSIRRHSQGTTTDESQLLSLAASAG